MHNPQSHTFVPPQPMHNPQSHTFVPPRKPTTLPDLIVSAVSLLFIFSSKSPSTGCSRRCSTTHYPKSPFPSLQCNPRRFLRVLSMSQPPVTANPLCHHRFANPQSLSEWLKPRLPSDSFASWGVKPGTKNVHNLWLELSQGEVSLADSNPPIRTVNVVSVRIIGKDNRVLVESHQELSDGSIRYRSRPLSEKMKPDEIPEEAAFRAMKEELGSVLKASVGDHDIHGVVRIMPGALGGRGEMRVFSTFYLV